MLTRGQPIEETENRMKSETPHFMGYEGDNSSFLAMHSNFSAHVSDAVGYLSLLNIVSTSDLHTNDHIHSEKPKPFRGKQPLYLPDWQDNRQGATRLTFR